MLSLEYDVFDELHSPSRIVSSQPRMGAHAKVFVVHALIYVAVVYSYCTFATFAIEIVLCCLRYIQQFEVLDIVDNTLSEAQSPTDHMMNFATLDQVVLVSRTEVRRLFASIPTYPVLMSVFMANDYWSNMALLMRPPIA